jgi:hypothetical protein
MRSADTDGDLATFTFAGSRFASPYLSFTPVEEADRDGHLLQTPSTQQLELQQKYMGSYVPFVDIAGRFWGPAGFEYEGVLSADMDWAAIAGALCHPNSSVAQAVVGNANYLTAGICSTTGNQPARACEAPCIQTIEQRLTKA